MSLENGMKIVQWHDKRVVSILSGLGGTFSITCCCDGWAMNAVVFDTCVKNEKLRGNTNAVDVCSNCLYHCRKYSCCLLQDTEVCPRDQCCEYGRFYGYNILYTCILL